MIEPDNKHLRTRNIGHKKVVPKEIIRNVKVEENTLFEIERRGKYKKMNYKEKYFKHYGLDKCDILLCAVCCLPAVNLHHIIKKSQGGTDEPDNLMPLCYKCHSGHHDRNNPTAEQLKELKKATG